MWERFSYYGMRALLVLYMVKYLLDPQRAGDVAGLGAFRQALEFVFGPLDIQPLSSQIYGLYTGLVYLTPIFGGFLADRVLGQRRTVILGAALMAVGHFMMAFEPLFLLALTVLILGNGAFKPNISTQVGGLYAPGDHRRDRAYSIFYVGINLGAFLAPLVCGTLGEEFGWHYGFAAAGIGMTTGLIIYLLAGPTLPIDAFAKRETAKEPLSREAWLAIGAIVLLMLPVSLYWGLLRAAGQHHRAVGRRPHRPSLRSAVVRRRNSGHLVPVVQPVHDLRLHAVHRGAVAQPRPTRALDGCQNGDRLHTQCRSLSADGRRRLDVARRTDELAVAVRLFHRHHHRRTLSVAGRALAGDQGSRRCICCR